MRISDFSANIYKENKKQFFKNILLNSQKITEFLYILLLFSSSQRYIFGNLQILPFIFNT